MTDWMDILRQVVSQQLLPDCHHGMVPACEILHLNSAVRCVIRDNRNHQIDNVIASGAREGMCSMDQSIAALYGPARSVGRRRWNTPTTLSS